MNHTSHDSLEEQLTQTTIWPGSHPDPKLWQRALDADAEQKRRVGAFGRRILNWSMPRTLAAGIVLLFAGSVLAAILTRTSTPRNLVVTGNAAASFENAPSLDLNAALKQGWNVGMYDLPAAVESYGYNMTPIDRSDGGGGGGGARLYSAMLAPNAFSQASSASEPSQDRSVIRKATIELITSDVRAVFAKAMHIISEAGGEYIQDSGLTGTDETAQATLTLRVQAERLGAVLNELRELGVVQSERISGEDVTSQIVDLEARLRNEQRVEMELLALLEKRNDAPLKEILEVRNSISNVRLAIEQIIAQQERLGRLVSLATVLVIIRPEPAPIEESKKQEERTISVYFGESLARSWHDGLHYLADALAGTVRIVVGGLIWWIAAIISMLTLRAHLQRRAMQ